MDLPDADGVEFFLGKLSWIINWHEAKTIPETRPDTSSSEAGAPPSAQPASWRLWFLIAAILGVLIGVGLTYKPAPTPLEEAVSLIKVGRHVDALPILEGISRKQPDNSEVFPWLAQCYLKTSRLAEGRTALDTALKLKLPGVLTAPVVLSYADYYEGKDDYNEAEQLYASAQSAIPESSLVLGRATLYMRWSEFEARKGKLEEAVNHLKLAYTLLPDNDSAKSGLPRKIADYYRQLALIAESEDADVSKATSLLEESLKWSDESGARISLGTIYMRAGRLPEAITNFQSACQQDPNNLEARHHLVDLYVQTGNMVGAQQALLDLTEKERSVENFQRLSSVNLQLANYAGAVRALEDAIVLRANDVELLQQLYDTLVVWNRVLIKEGKLDDSMSVKGHSERVGELLAALKKDDQVDDAAADPGVNAKDPPVSLATSRIWLAKGSFTPEGEIRFKNISGRPVTDLAFNIVFYDNTTRRQISSVTITAASVTHPLAPSAVRSTYFSCPDIVKREHQLAVIIMWKGRFLKELPVVKER